MSKIGFQYPFRFEDGAPAAASGDALVAASLMKLISTLEGEIVYDDENGHGLLRYIFDNLDPLVAAHVRRDLTLAVLRVEPRASVVAVPVTVVNEGGQKVLDVTVVWAYQGKVFSTRRTLPLQEQS